MARPPLISPHLLGIACLVTALSLNAVKDGTAKILGDQYSPLMLIWVQMVFTSLVLIPIVWKKYGAAIILPRPLGPQILRGGLCILGVALFYWSLTFIPLTDTTAMVFIAPIVVTAASPLLLREKLGLHRTLAVFVGFVGMLVILRPDLGGERQGYFIGLVAGISLGLFYVANRRLAEIQPPLAAVTYTAIIGVVLLLPVLPFTWSAPRTEDLALISVFLVFATVGQIFLITAFLYTPASELAPFQYTQLVAATLFGMIVFDSLPDPVTWTGIALVVGAGLYIAFRESRSITLAER
ncbi:MAG: DMT family transporter [Rhodospirillales bacterium]|nr:DMT family transporter [Rhodospirillales bacterium]